MNDQFALLMLDAFYRSANQLMDLAPILKEHCSDEDVPNLEFELDV